MNVTTAPASPAAATVISAGTVTTGAVVSPTAAAAFTVTLKLALPVFPAASVAVHVTVVTPTGNVLPDTGAQPGSGRRSTSSTADTVNDTPRRRARQPAR